MNMAEKIKIYRQRKNLTQEKLAELIGVSVMTVKRWEWEQRIPRADELGKLAQALGTTAGYLLGETDNAGASEKPSGENKSLPISNSVSEDDLDLGYWGAMAQRAERVARSEDESKKEIIGVLLRKAAAEVTGNTGGSMKGGGSIYNDKSTHNGDNNY